MKEKGGGRTEPEERNGARSREEALPDGGVSCVAGVRSPELAALRYFRRYRKFACGNRFRVHAIRAGGVAAFGSHDPMLAARLAPPCKPYAPAVLRCRLCPSGATTFANMPLGPLETAAFSSQNPALSALRTPPCDPWAPQWSDASCVSTKTPATRAGVEAFGVAAWVYCVLTVTYLASYSGLYFMQRSSSRTNSPPVNAMAS